MRKVFLLFPFFVFILLAGCIGKKYLSPHFDAQTAQHKTIAILPFQLLYTGRVPNYLTTTDVETLRYAEARAFQNNLHQQLQSQTGTRKNDIRIEIQPTETTNKLLQDSGLSYVNLNTATIQQICKKLGVDAVVVSVVEKERFLYPLDTLGVSIPGAILEKLVKNNPYLNQNLPEIPGNVARTYHVKAGSRLKNGNDDTLLWEYSVETDVDWQTAPLDLISLINKQTSKKFPYRRAKPNNTK